MTKRKPLRWLETGRGRHIPDCLDCYDWIRQPGMREAVASVGIETGGIDIYRLVNDYHANRHEEAPDAEH